MNPQGIHQYKGALYYLPVIAWLLLLIGKSIHAPIGDFGNYYYASEFLLQGKWGLWVYDAASFNLAVYEEGQRNFFLNYTPVPPFSALLYVPFALMNAADAKLVWNGINALLFLVALYRMQRYFKIDPLVVLLVPVLFYTPIRNTLYEGQSYLLLFFLLAEGLMRYLQDQKWYAVLLWALAVHLKISPAFILLFLLCEKDWKASLQLLLCGILLLLVAVPFLGLQTWSNYGWHILPRLYSGEINDTYAVNYQSMQVLLKTVFVPDVLHNPGAWFNNPAWYHRLTTLFIITVYGFTILCSFAKVKPEIKFSIWLIASLLVSGYGNSFSLLLLLLPVCCIYPYIRESKMALLLVSVVLFCTANLQLSWFADLPLPLQFPRLYLLMIAFVALVIWIKPPFKLYYLPVLFLAFFMQFPVGLYNQNYVLKQEEDILIYRFKPMGRMLQLDVFNGSGPQQRQVPVSFEIKKIKEASPQQIMHGREHIPVSYLVNDSVIIYLSDKNRGVGFYTLRYEKLK